MMTFVQILEIGRLAMNLPRLAEIELVNSLVRQLGIKIVNTAVALNLDNSIFCPTAQCAALLVWKYTNCQPRLLRSAML